MAVYTEVGEREVAALLARYDLGALIALEPIAEGIENTNYFVTAEGGRFVLTLFESSVPREDLPFFVALTGHLAARGIPCPRPLADRGGACLQRLAGRPAVLVERLPGASVTAPRPAHCAAAGELLARLHAAAADFPRHRPNPRGAAWREATAAQVRPRLDPVASRLLAEEVAAQALPPPAGLPRGIVHADLFRDNVLFEDGRLSGVIDFYYACSDVLLLDVAIAVNDWCAVPGGGLDETRAAALVGAYAAVRPFTPEEHAAWPRMLRLAALRFWLSRLYDWHFPREGVLARRKDPDEYRRLLEAHRAAAPPLAA
ncbi:homoserine kinase [Inmirania thermothiophila]|uniref:Homoserine kinase n=1 Tax=Inmirania thermothiophila TaxID=1750597 RepID=A0A3N1Y6Y5_9GAMM|nr:homoserine kinase [Inmirania thermothiophila]ROR34278.1 homoserine kinase [Inmirania thermothiophila]